MSFELRDIDLMQPTASVLRIYSRKFITKYLTISGLGISKREVQRFDRTAGNYRNA